VDDTARERAMVRVLNFHYGPNYVVFKIALFSYLIELDSKNIWWSRTPFGKGEVIKFESMKQL
jgi:hypothetical protein